MASNPKHSYTPEEYLSLERKARHKSQYYAGEIFAMSGASREHNVIVLNIATALSTQLEEKDCEIYAVDMRVKTPNGMLYTYPDVVVVCGKPQFEDSSTDTLLNPSLILEVLSPSTETYDRTKKFEDYRNIESLKEYVLVAQKERRITQFVKQVNGGWIFHEFCKANDLVHFDSIDCKLTLERAYRRVEFSTQNESPGS